MNAELKKIFGDAITVGNKSIPVAYLRYKGEERTFVTWKDTGERAELYANDELIAYSVGLDVDVFSNGNYTKLITEIKRLLKDNDWQWVEDSMPMYEEDTGLYHKTLTFYKEGEI